MFKFVGVAAVSALVLMGCSTDALINQAYPDRSKYTFLSSDGETRMSYLCERGSSEAATKARATKAHRYLDANINAAVDRMVDQIFDESSVDPKTMNKQLEAQMELVVNKAEEDYQCLFFDAVDV